MTQQDSNAVPAPRIIPRAEHGISRKQISANALRVLYRLREGGFQAHLVGGAVRDLLLGGAPKDYDVATDATPEQVKHLFRNCRLIGRRFRLAHVMFGREIIEVATFRANIDDGSGQREMDNGRLVRDNVYGSIEDDAVRRDFTANALYYSIEDFSVIDYVGGYEDVRRRGGVAHQEPPGPAQLGVDVRHVAELLPGLLEVRRVPVVLDQAADQRVDLVHVVGHVGPVVGHRPARQDHARQPAGRAA